MLLMIFQLQTPPTPPLKYRYNLKYSYVPDSQRYPFIRYLSSEHRGRFCRCYFFLSLSLLNKSLNSLYEKPQSEILSFQKGNEESLQEFCSTESLKGASVIKHISLKNQVHLKFSIIQTNLINRKQWLNYLARFSKIS